MARISDSPSSAKPMTAATAADKMRALADAKKGPLLQDQQLSQEKRNELLSAVSQRAEEQAPKSPAGSLDDVLTAARAAAPTVATPQPAPVEATPQPAPVAERIAPPFAPTNVMAALDSPERRQVIESRLQPLSMYDLVVNGDVSQVITVIPGKFTMRLRTLQHFENLYCLDQVSDVQGSFTFVEQTLGTFRIACALQELNGVALPEHRGEDRRVLPEVFKRKVQFVQGLASIVLADVAFQYDWLMARVAKLMTDPDALKNG